MPHSRTTQAAMIGCLAALATFCALQARGGETYSIVAQSNRSSAATGRRPLAERIAAANLPIIVQAPGRTPASPSNEPAPQENVAVAAVKVPFEEAAAPPAGKPGAASQKAAARSPQATAWSFWKTLTGSQPATVTR